jgi:hypothetical protein
MRMNVNNKTSAISEMLKASFLEIDRKKTVREVACEEE